MERITLELKYLVKPQDKKNGNIIINDNGSFGTFKEEAKDAGVIELFKIINDVLVDRLILVEDASTPAEIKEEGEYSFTINFNYSMITDKASFITNVIVEEMETMDDNEVKLLMELLRIVNDKHQYHYYF